MRCNPVRMVDPLGLQYFAPASPVIYQDPSAFIRAIAPALGMHLPGGSVWGLSNVSHYISSLSKELQAEAWIMYLSGNSSSFLIAYERYLWQKDMRNLKQEREEAKYNDNILLPTLYVRDSRPAWTAWAERMREQFGTSLGYSFEGYGEELNGRNKISSLFDFSFMNASNYTNASQMPTISIYKDAIVIKSSMVDGGAVALPPFIIIDPGETDVQGTLRHEYGHQLQRLMTNFVGYYLYVGLPSIISANKANSDSEYNHQEFYSEKSANQLSYWIHGKPADWDHYRYPVYKK